MKECYNCMYRLIFLDKVVSCDSLFVWQKRVIEYQMFGKSYDSFERTAFGWSFYFNCEES